MAQMQDQNAVSSNAVENRKRIAAKERHTHIETARRHATAFRPSLQMADNLTDAPL
jgi:hypothetical protein